jgi:phasin
MAYNTDPFSFSRSAFSPSAFASSAFAPGALSEMPESMRAFAEQGLAQARDGYQKFKEAAESNNGAIEAACQSAAKGASDYTAKLMEIAKTNTDEAFGFASALLGSKSMTDAFALMNAHTQKQFGLLTAQSRDLVELGQKMAADAAEPIKAGAAKAFRPV